MSMATADGYTPQLGASTTALSAKGSAAISSAVKATRDVCDQLIRRPPTAARLGKASRWMEGLKPLQQYMQQLVDEPSSVHVQQAQAATATRDACAALQQQLSLKAVDAQLVKGLVKVALWVDVQQDVGRQVLSEVFITLLSLMHFACALGTLNEQMEQQELVQTAVVAQALDAGLMACLLHVTNAIHNQSCPTGSYAVPVLFGIANMLMVLTNWDCHGGSMQAGRPMWLMSLRDTHLLDLWCATVMRVMDRNEALGSRSSSTDPGIALTRQALQSTTRFARAAITRLSVPLGQPDGDVQHTAGQAPLKGGCSDNTYAQLCGAILQQPNVALFLTEALGAQLAHCEPRPYYTALPPPRPSSTTSQYLCHEGSAYERSNCAEDFMRMTLAVHCGPVATTPNLLDARILLLYLEALVCVDPLRYHYAGLCFLLWRLRPEQLAVLMKDAAALLVQLFANAVDDAVSASTWGGSGPEDDDGDAMAKLKDMCCCMHVLTRHVAGQDRGIGSLEGTRRAVYAPPSVLWQVVSVDNGRVLVTLEKALRAEMGDEVEHWAVPLLWQTFTVLTANSLHASAQTCAAVAGLVVTLGKWLLLLAAQYAKGVAAQGTAVLRDYNGVVKVLNLAALVALPGLGYGFTTTPQAAQMTPAREEADKDPQSSDRRHGLAGAAGVDAAEHSMRPATQSAAVAVDTQPPADQNQPTSSAAVTSAGGDPCQQASEMLSGIRILMLCRLGGAAARAMQHMLRADARCGLPALEPHLQQLHTNVSIGHSAVFGDAGCLQLRAALRTRLLPQQRAAFDAVAAAATTVGAAGKVSDEEQRAAAARDLVALEASAAALPGGATQASAQEQQAAVSSTEDLAAHACIADAACPMESGQLSRPSQTQDDNGVLKALDDMLANMATLADVQVPSHLLPGCHNPACTNMTCPAEAKLKTKLCAGCAVARFCNKECLVQAWPLHRPLCRAQAATNASLSSAEQLGAQQQ